MSQLKSYDWSDWLLIHDIIFSLPSHTHHTHTSRWPKDSFQFKPPPHGTRKMERVRQRWWCGYHSNKKALRGSVARQLTSPDRGGARQTDRQTDSIFLQTHSSSVVYLQVRLPGDIQVTSSASNPDRNSRTPQHLETPGNTWRSVQCKPVLHQHKPVERYSHRSLVSIWHTHTYTHTHTHTHKHTHQCIYMTLKKTKLLG